jgi:hypothetical protein
LYAKQKPKAIVKVNLKAKRTIDLERDIGDKTNIFFGGDKTSI